MGATKRLAELFCQSLDLEGEKTQGSPRFVTVRFGNVLGSSGSLIPLFKRQLSRGGPLTVTHPEMKRYFMTIREAVELTLQASAYAVEKKLGSGEIFVLDMGEPIKIVEIARRMIRLAGFTPDKEVKIEIVGTRPGEKLFEELFDETEKRVSPPVPGVFGAVPNPVPLADTLRDVRQASRLRIGRRHGRVCSTRWEPCFLASRAGTSRRRGSRAKDSDAGRNCRSAARRRAIWAAISLCTLGQRAAATRSHVGRSGSCEHQALPSQRFGDQPPTSNPVSQRDGRPDSDECPSYPSAAA